MERFRNDWLAVAALSALWAAAFALIGIGGEYPLSDDWAYARTTRGFLETGRIERVSWTWAPIVSNVWIGAVFGKLLGPADTTFRLSSLCMGWLGVLGAHALFRQVGAPLREAAFGAAVFGFCPIYLNLSYTFMTDVPFTAFCVWGLALFARGATRASLPSGLPWIAAAAACIAAATLSRQPGLAVAGACALSVATLLLRRPRALVLALGAGAVALAGLAAVATRFFGEGDVGGVPGIAFFMRWVLGNPNVPYFFVASSLTSMAYLGLFALPVVLLAAPHPAAEGRLRGLAAVSGVLVPLGLWRLDRPLPPGVNVLFDFGLGARTLDGQEHLPSAPDAFWWTLLAIGGASFGMAAGRIALGLWTRRRQLLDEPQWVMLASFPVAYLGILFLRFPFFDRYLLAPLAAFLALLVGLAPGSGTRPRRVAEGAAVAAFAVLALFAVSGTRDYHARHEARWVLLDELIARAVDTRRIDGGFEFSGIHNFHQQDQLFLDSPSRWVYDDEFLVSYAPSVDGYDLMERVVFRTWMPPREGAVHLHQRRPGTPSRYERRPPSDSGRTRPRESD